MVLLRATLLQENFSKISIMGQNKAFSLKLTPYIWTSNYLKHRYEESIPGITPVYGIVQLHRSENSRSVSVRDADL